MLPSNRYNFLAKSERGVKKHIMAVSVGEEIDELQRKIALLDGDKKAYSESSQWAMKQNKNLIFQLRNENKLLRSKLSRRMKADDEVIAEVFQGHKVRMPAELHGVNGDVAITRFDQSVCEMIKRRNSLQHMKRSHEDTLSGLEAEIRRIEMEAESLAATPGGSSKEAKNLRQLENSLDKAVIKNSEAKHIKKAYEAIIQKLQDEHMGFDNEIAALERAIKLRKKDLTDLESMCTDAQLAREMAKTELNRLEQSMADSRKQREKVLSDYRTKANEKKEFAEKVERRLRRASVLHSAGPSGFKSNQELQEAKITSYEEALAKIKDATGVSNIQEVVDRFLNQGNTKKHLEQLKEENTRQLARLKEEKEKLQAQFEDMKYSGEAKMSTGQRLLEEFEGHLDGVKQSCKASKEKADRTCKLLAQVKNGTDHLDQKLQHIKAPQTHVLKPKLDPGSEEYVLDQLSVAEQKLVNLAEELTSRDLETIHKEMEDTEFRHTVEGGVAGNIRVELPKISSKSNLYDDESGSDEEYTSRDAMKRTTAALVEAKTKKKVQDDDEEDDSKKKRKRR